MLSSELLISWEAPVERSGVDMGVTLLPRFVDSTIARECDPVAIKAKIIDDHLHNYLYVVSNQSIFDT